MLPLQPSSPLSRAASASVYELAGGMDAFVRLVDVFYDRVKLDPVLSGMFPQDMAGPKERLALFLAQFFGGPQTYSETRGHPRLRMRHLPFAIGRAERDAWVAHMLAALEEAAIPDPPRSQMRTYFEDAATFMMNR